MVRNLIDDHYTMASLAPKGVKLAGEENDAATENMLYWIQRVIDKTILMLQVVFLDVRIG